MKIILEYINKDKKMFRLLIICISIVLLMTLVTSGRFMSPKNLSAILFLTPELGVLAMGIMLAMIVGGIDLSIVATANLSAIIAAKTMLIMGNSSTSVLVGCLIAIAVGAACGFFNGLLISRVKLHPILVTLGTFQLYQGIAIVLTQGSAVTNLPNQLTRFGNETLLGLPYPFLILIVVWQLLVFLLNKTYFGQSLYLIGTNYKASIYSAVDSDSYLNKVYTIVGVLGAIAGLIMVARTNSAKADYGASYTLQTILICMLGGVSWAGGSGKPGGVMIAVFILQFLASGFGLLRYSNFFKDFTSGAFLIIILIFYYYMEIYDEKKSKKLLVK